MYNVERPLLAAEGNSFRYSRETIARFLDLMGINKNSVQIFLRDRFYNSPITFFQSTLGISFYFLRLSNIVPGHVILFHPALITGRAFELYRGLASSYILDGGAISLLFQVIRSYYWKSQLESSFGTQTRLALISSGMGKKTGLRDLLCMFVSNMVKDHYFHLQLLSISIIVGQEVILYYIFGGAYVSSLRAVNPEWLTRGGQKIVRSDILYSLNPNFEYTLFIIWVMRFRNAGIQMFNLIPAPVILLPVTWLIANRFRGLGVITKSLITAVIVSKIMDLKCHASDEDMVDGIFGSLKKTVSSFIELFM